MSFTRRQGPGRPRQTSRLEDRHIVRNERVQPTASSAAIQAQVEPSLCLPEPYEGAWLKDIWDRGAHCVFNVSSDDSRVCVRRPCGERLNPAFDSQQHTAPTAGVMLWGDIAYNTWSPLVLILGTMIAQRHVHDILQPHVFSLMQWHLGAIFQQDNARPRIARVSQDYLRTVTILPWRARSPDLSPIGHIWNHLGWRIGHPTSLNELEARLQQMLNEMSQDIIHNCMLPCPIVSHRTFALEGFQHGIKSSVLLPFSLINK
ncbi:transposable element Tcb2 transposase [Trichonephila clavipes]|nr:transposable element Tcb2 transposase [Trichonephila clavipes]